MTRLIGRLEGKAEKYYTIMPWGALFFNYLMLSPAFILIVDQESKIVISPFAQGALVAIASFYAIFSTALTALAYIRDPFARPLVGCFMVFAGPFINAIFFVFFLIDSTGAQVFTVFVGIFVLQKVYKLNKKIAHSQLIFNCNNFYESEGDNYNYKWSGMEVLKNNIYQQNPLNATFNISLLEMLVLLLAYPVGYFFFLRGVTGNVSEAGMVLFAWGVGLTSFYITRAPLMDFVIHMRMIALIKKRLRLGQLPPPASTR